MTHKEEKKMKSKSLKKALAAMLALSLVMAPVMGAQRPVPAEMMPQGRLPQPQTAMRPQNRILPFPQRRL